VGEVEHWDEDINELTRRPFHYRALPTMAKNSQISSASGGTRPINRQDRQVKADSVLSERREPVNLLGGQFDGQKMWNPGWLSAMSLICFMCLFAALVLALILLWHYSNLYNGFTLISLNHYAWTYGPTAVLVIIVSLWRQVDFYCKALTPWNELRKGGATASRSLLLDYISPIQPISLGQALKFRHFSVIATILAFTTLKLVTLVSTGLLGVVTSQMPATNVTLTAKTAISGSSYNTTKWDAMTSLDSSVFYSAYAYIAKGLPYPEGMKGNVVYPTFELPAFDSTINSSFIVEVDVFYPHFICEVAQVTVANYPPNSTSGTANISVSSPSCSIPRMGAQPTLSLEWPDVNLVSPRQLTGQMQPVNCSGQEWGDASAYIGAIDAYSRVNWQLLTMADVRYNQTIPSGLSSTSSINATAWSTVIEQVSGIVCLPSYSMEKARVSYDLAQSPPRVTVDGPLTRTNATLPGFSSQNMTYEFFNVKGAADGMFGGVLNSDLLLETQDPFFQIISQVYGGGYVALLNATTLKEAAPVAFQNILAQMIHKYLVSPSSASLPGQLLQSENRLHIRAFPLWVMVGGFLTLVGLSFVTLLCRPRNVVPQDPEPIASIALVMAQSGDLQHILEGTGRAKLDDIRERLSSFRYASRIVASRDNPAVFKVEATVDRERSSSTPLPQLEWWRPFPIWIPVVTLTLLLPIMVIVIIEILQRVSFRNDGIAPMPNDSGIDVQFYSRYLPAVVMLLIATLYNSLDFTVSLFAPFHALRLGSASASKSIRSSLLEKTPPIALFAALRDSHWSAFFSTTAALLGSVLTILSSGLYTVEGVPAAKTIQLQRTDSFNTTWSNSAFNDSHAAILTSLTESSNLTNPPFTSEEMAFPAIQGLEPSWEQNFKDLQSPLNVTLPALRASLNCTLVPASAVNVTGDFELNVGVTIGVEARHPLPPNCLLGGPGRNLSFMNWTNYYDFNSDTSSEAYIGAMLDLHVGPWNEGLVDESSGEYDTPPQNDNPPGCPSLAFTFGHLAYKLKDPVTDNETGQTYYQTVATQTNLTTMICYQLLDEIQSNVTFLPPDFTISTAQPPIPHEDSVRHLASGPHGETSFEYRPQSHITNELKVLGQTQYPNPSLDWPILDNFFLAVLAGKHPIEPANLTGEANQDNLMKAVQGFYRRYMAQAISANMRVSAPSASPEIYAGTWQDPNGWRIKQNVGSKIAIQVFLGIMFVCGTLAYILAKMRHTLPHDPCSIAGVGSLLAGSELCGEQMRRAMPDGVQWMSDKELKQNRVWEGWLFSIGWWERKGGEAKRFGIDVGRAEKVD
jgi:hypothetical protein